MNNSLKENVKKLAKERGVSIRKLEQDIGIADKSISKWDKMMPSIDKVEKVAQYFGVTVDSLLGYTGDYDNDLQKLMDTATWLTKEDLVALIVVAEQLKKGK